MESYGVKYQMGKSFGQNLSKLRQGIHYSHPINMLIKQLPSDQLIKIYTHFGMKPSPYFHKKWTF